MVTIHIASFATFYVRLFLNGSTMLRLIFLLKKSFLDFTSNRKKPSDLYLNIQKYSFKFIFELK